MGGPPSSVRDGIAPLSGVVETDWSPYTFTMNWKLTRPDHWVRFEADEPFCHLLPVERAMVEDVRPRYLPIEAAPALKAQFEAWSASRNAFQRRMRDAPPSKPADKWQKLYYRGVDPTGAPGAPDHRTKLTLAPFAPGDASAPIIGRRACLRALSPRWTTIPSYDRVDPARFLDDHHAANFPALAADWPAASWTTETLATKVGDVDRRGGGAWTHRSPAIWAWCPTC